MSRQWYEKEYKRKTKMHITANKKSSWYYRSSDKASLDLGLEQSFLRFKRTGLQSWTVWNNFTLFLNESWTQESWSRHWMPTVYTWNQYNLKSVITNIFSSPSLEVKYLQKQKETNLKKGHLGLLVLILSTKHLGLDGDLLQRKLLKVFDWI